MSQPFYILLIPSGACCDGIKDRNLALPEPTQPVYCFHLKESQAKVAQGSQKEGVYDIE